MEIRLMLQTEVDEVKAFAKTQDKLGVEFSYLWSSWQYWTKHVPIIARDDTGAIVGARAATLSTKSGYLYNYYVMVDPSARRQRLAVRMLDLLLSIHAGKAKRFRSKSRHTSRGRAVLESLGAHPIGKDKEQVWFDFDISPVNGVESLREWMRHPEQHEPVSIKMMLKYVKEGMTPISHMMYRFPPKD